MFDVETLGVIAQLGLGLAGFSGIALVLMRGGPELSRLETHRLGIMLGVSLGATFLAVLPLGLPDLPGAAECVVASLVMAAYTALFLLYYTRATLGMKSLAPELVSPWPFALVLLGHASNVVLQAASACQLVKCEPAYRVGLLWMLFHGAYQFGRILFIRPRSISRFDASTNPADPADTDKRGPEV